MIELETIPVVKLDLPPGVNRAEFARSLYPSMCGELIVPYNSGGSRQPWSDDATQSIFRTDGTRVDVDANNARVKYTRSHSFSRGSAADRTQFKRASTHVLNGIINSTYPAFSRGRNVVVPSSYLSDSGETVETSRSARTALLEYDDNGQFAGGKVLGLPYNNNSNQFSLAAVSSHFGSAAVSSNSIQKIFHVDSGYVYAAIYQGSSNPPFSYSRYSKSINNSKPGLSFGASNYNALERIPSDRGELLHVVSNTRYTALYNWNGIGISFARSETSPVTISGNEVSITDSETIEKFIAPSEYIAGVDLFQPWPSQQANYLSMRLVPTKTKSHGVAWAFTYHRTDGAPLDFGVRPIPNWFRDSFIAFRNPLGTYYFYSISPPLRPRYGPYAIDAGITFPNYGPALLWVDKHSRIWSVWRDNNDDFWVCRSGFPGLTIPSGLANWSRVVNPLEQ